jgi:hypothetical protein
MADQFILTSLVNMCIYVQYTEFYVNTVLFSATCEDKISASLVKVDFYSTVLYIYKLVFKSVFMARYIIDNLYPLNL